MTLDDLTERERQVFLSIVQSFIDTAEPVGSRYLSKFPKLNLSPATIRNVMADLEEKSYKEIADSIGCPIGTVMSRLFRGRKLMRNRLQNYARQHRLLPGGKTGKPATRLADAQ